ncbi:hypothetical protein HDU92_004118 [Lobulomyces angularis]|nr:hypothetical protein HDU92_004118 [Lobulomyces angularis]
MFNKKKIPLTFGINVKSKNDNLKNLPTQKKSIIDTKDRVDLGGESSSSSSDEDKSDTKDVIIKRANKQINTSSSLKEELLVIQNAQEEDPDIFDYDKSYDRTKLLQETKKKLKRGELDQNGRLKPRYIENIKKASEQRKLDYELAEEKKIERERKQENGLFDEKEKFVTDNYKKLQLERELLKKKEENEEAKIDMNGFYKGILQDFDRDNDVSIVSKAEEALLKEKLRLDQEEEEILKDKIEENTNIKVNDSNEVVDKSKLLKGGLNISKKKIIQMQREEEVFKEEIKKLKLKEQEEARLREEEFLKRRKLKAERIRQSMLLKQQQQEVDLKEKKLKEEDLQDFKANLKRKVDEVGLLSAKERYLQRKKLMDVKKEESSSDSD